MLGSFIGLLALCKIVIDCVKVGPSKVFSQQKRNKPPACLEDSSLGTHGYAHLEDIRMHYVSNGSEDKPLMLLVHGFPEFWYSWRYQLKEFKDRYRVVAVDLRGYNETDKPSGISSYKTAKLATDLKQLITALGYSDCVLVGHDWGGAVCWAFAEKFPDLVNHLIILNCPNIKAFRKHVRSSLKQVKMSWYMYFFQLPFLPELMFKLQDYAILDQLFRSKHSGVRSDRMSDEDIEAYKYTFSRSGLTGPINFYRAAFEVERRPPDQSGSRSKGISVPTLVLWGTEDAALDNRLAEMSCEVCTGKVVLRYIEGASHWVQMDRPDLVNKYMREFLTESEK
ncbi:epoxide hydrolase 4-like [Pomacea canaliculata]|uniref:epoxide hydrolase 4-like n=1 Tax=Pomacea canaliculata TaxID=400727 RepID=UPI000D72831C|nr:epoxide hydrolase 4-like [Pomacea canaliculata]